jgi:hypothetical protein
MFGKFIVGISILVTLNVHSADVFATREGGHLINIKEICIEGVAYYYRETNSGWKHYAKGYAHLAPAYDAKTKQVKLCNHAKKGKK